jgi:hypothetical protein
VHIDGLDSARDLGPPRDGASQRRSQRLGFLRNGEQPASRAIRRPMRASIPLHLAANGSIEVGQETSIVLGGDATELPVSAGR